MMSASKGMRVNIPRDSDSAIHIFGLFYIFDILHHHDDFDNYDDQRYPHACDLSNVKYVPDSIAVANRYRWSIVKCSAAWDAKDIRVSQRRSVPSFRSSSS